MVKKIIEDVLSLKKDGANVFRPAESREAEVAQKESDYKQPETKHVEEILPVDSSEESEKEAVLNKSPIFTKMKQRHEERESFSEEYATSQESRIRKYLGKTGIAIGLIAVVAVIVWSTLLYSASVVIHVKHVKANMDAQEFSAVTAVDAINKPDSVTYQIMSLSDSSTIKLTATGEKRMTAKASGDIVVYNTFGTAPQILMKNTRFQTPDAKIYRISKQITVPGMKKVAGKDVPGSIQVTVYADEAGPEYNIGLTDFTIPGFKGSPRFQKFYARSKTAMTGGASGLVKTISEADKETARTALIKDLKEKLLASAVAGKPEGTVLYPDAMFFTYTETVNDASVAGQNDVPFILKGDLQAVLFNEDELSRQIVKTVGENALNEKIKIDSIDKLSFAWKTPLASAPSKTDTIGFLLSGSANAVWSVDVKAFKSKLAGTPESAYNSVSVQFPGIEKTSKKTITPFWRHTFPSNVEKISVESVID